MVCLHRPRDYRGAHGYNTPRGILDRQGHSQANVGPPRPLVGCRHIPVGIYDGIRGTISRVRLEPEGEGWLVEGCFGFAQAVLDSGPQGRGCHSLSNQSRCWKGSFTLNTMPYALCPMTYALHL